MIQKMVNISRITPDSDDDTEDGTVIYRALRLIQTMIQKMDDTEDGTVIYRALRLIQTMIQKMVL